MVTAGVYRLGTQPKNMAGTRRHSRGVEILPFICSITYSVSFGAGVLSWRSVTSSTPSNMPCPLTSPITAEENQQVCLET